MLELGQSWRASLAKDAPVAQPGVPTCPRWMSDPEARRCWRQTVAQLQIMRTLSKADTNALVRYCVTWARWVRAHQHVLKYGEAYPLKDQQGTLRCFMPYVQSGVSIKLSQHLSQLEAEFGLTPASRTRLRPEYASVEEQHTHALLVKYGLHQPPKPYDPDAFREKMERAKRESRAADRRRSKSKAKQADRKVKRRQDEPGTPNAQGSTPTLPTTLDSSLSSSSSGPGTPDAPLSLPITPADSATA